METYAGGTYAPFGASSTGQSSVLNPQPTPPLTNPTMASDSHYFAWPRIDLKAVIAKNTLTPNDILLEQRERALSSILDAIISDPSLSEPTGFNKKSPDHVEDQEKSVSMSISPSPEPEIAQPVEDDRSENGTGMGSKQEPISISESPSPQLSPQNDPQLEDDCHLAGGNASSTEAQPLSVSAQPSSPQFLPQNLPQAVKEYCPPSLPPKVMPPLRYSTALGMIPISDGQSVVDPPKYLPPLRTENKSLADRNLPAKSNEKCNVWETLYPLFNDEKRMPREPEMPNREDYAKVPASQPSVSEIDPAQVEEYDSNGGNAGKDWDGPLITLGSFSGSGAPLQTPLKSLGPVDYRQSKALKRQQPDVEHSEDDEYAPTKKSKKQKKDRRLGKVARALKDGTLPVPTSDRFEGDHTHLSNYNHVINFDDRLSAAAGVTKSGQLYPIFGRRIGDKQPQNQATLTANSNVVDQSSTGPSLMTQKESTTQIESPAIASLLPIQPIQMENLESLFDRATGRASSEEAQQAAKVDRPLHKAERTIISINKARERTPLPSAPSTIPTKPPISNLKIPKFPKIVGFRAIYHQLGYLSFVARLWEVNGGNVTLYQVEDAWRAFIRSEYQKWEATSDTYDPVWGLQKYDELIGMIEKKRNRVLNKIEKKNPNGWQLEAIEGTHQFTLVEKKVPDDMGVSPGVKISDKTKSTNTPNMSLEGCTSYLAGNMKGQKLPLISKDTQLQYASDWYWRPDGKPFETPTSGSASGTEVIFDVQANSEQIQSARVKSEISPGRTGFENEDLYDISEDEGTQRAAPRRKLSHPSQNDIIDLTLDDSDDERADVSMDIPDEEEEEGADYFMNGA